MRDGVPVTAQVAGEADREMIGALGVDIARLYTLVFALGAALAGLAGALVGSSGAIQDFVVRPNGNVVAVRAFTSAGGTPVNHIAEWNGSQWFPLGGGVPGLNGKRLLLMPNGDVLLGGERTSSSTGR